MAYIKNRHNVRLRFYSDLNLLLSRERRGVSFIRSLTEPASVKDVIESCGVPHTEVDVILVNGEPEDFQYLVTGDEQISVYPVIHSIDIPATDRLQNRELHDPRFVVDVNLGKLVRYLRLCGFNTAYRNNTSDSELINTMLKEDRVLLTRDRKLLMHKVIRNGMLVYSDEPVDQLVEVMNRFELYTKTTPFSRCINCNGILELAKKADVIDQLEPLTKRYFDRFSKCNQCGQVYWDGSHRKRLQSKLKKILDL
jgi:uncharacterized protein